MKNIKKAFILSVFFAVLFGAAVYAQSGVPALYLDPATQIVNEGDTFTVSIRLDTGGRNINAVEGELVYDSQDMEAIQISSRDSVLTFWTERPDYSNSRGVVNFAGGTTKNYNGLGGEIAKITFQTLRTGTVRLSFRSGAIMAADGSGTNIIERMISGAYTVIPPAEDPVAENYLPASGAPRAPTITSQTHSDQNRWYAQNNPVFSWDVPTGVSAVRLLVNKQPDSVPSVEYVPPISERRLDDLEDGIWYFHVQMRNSAGWGGVGHYKFNIDTTAPIVSRAAVRERENTTNPRVTLVVDAQDAVSGIAEISVQIDSGLPVSWGADTNEFITEPLDPGEHSFVVRVRDEAGNESIETLHAVIDPLPVPEILEYPRQVHNNDLVTIRGTAVPRSNVVLLLDREGDQEVVERTVQVDAAGNFSYVFKEPLSDGVYELHMQAVDDRGGQSEISEAVVFSVREPFVVRFGNSAINVLSILLPLIALLAGTVFVIWYGWNKFIILRRKLKKDIIDVEQILHVQFELLKKDLEDHMSHLEKIKQSRELTEEEHRFLDTFSQHLKEGERRVEKKIKGAEDDLGTSE